MNNIDNFLAEEIQQDELYSILAFDNLNNIINASIDNNLINENSDLNVLANSNVVSNETISQENNYNLNNDSNMENNVDNSFLRFANSVFEFAREGENAFIDNPESIPGQIYDSIFNFNPEWRNLNRGANAHSRSNERITQYFSSVNNNQSTSQPQNFFDLINSLVNIENTTNQLASFIQNYQDSEVKITLDSDVLDNFEIVKL